MDLRQMDAQLKKLSIENQQWGGPVGKLRTEILEGSKSRMKGDYARLIKLYFEDIARKERAAQKR